MSAKILRFPTGQAEVVETTESPPDLLEEVTDFMSKVEDLDDVLDNEAEFWETCRRLRAQIDSWFALHPDG